MENTESARISSGERPGTKSFLTRRFFKFINYYPPLLGAGIQVYDVSPDYRTIRVRMKLTRLNRNAVGTHFGGSLYVMCDPFYMLMMMHHLGREYIVWDKAAEIQFINPGRGTVYATFEMPEGAVEAVRRRADSGEKVEPAFEVDVLDDEQRVIAHVRKLLYVRKKSK
jgi:acyl-coenzyme A thioesterase PaaI-like protein